MNRYAKPAEGLILTATLALMLSAACAEEPAGIGTGTGSTRSTRAEPASTTAPVSRSELAQGRYLVDHVLLCADCHSRRDWSLYSGPVEPGTEWLGGAVDIFRDATPAPPIPATALDGWGVSGLADALLTGRTPSGATIHDRWMLSHLEVLRPADARAVAGYLLSGPDSSVEPESANRLSGAERGSFLVSIGRCRLCHGDDLSGGREIAVPGGASLPSANITIHPTTGIGRMSRSELIDSFKSLSGPELTRIAVPEGEANTAMPWPQLSGMTREDLGAIYDYIATLPAVDRTVGHP
jgi:hypothetical protein